MAVRNYSKWPPQVQGNSQTRKNSRKILYNCIVFSIQRQKGPFTEVGSFNCNHNNERIHHVA